MNALGLLPFDKLALLPALFHSELALALVLLAITTALVAFCVPGVIMPLSFSSGALLGGWTGMIVVVSGALLGSQVLFLVVRYLLQAQIRLRLGSRLGSFEHHFARRGVLYVIGLRLGGAPHPVVTAGCALTSLSSASFGAANLIGLLPVIAITAAAGSIV
jgi:uncharacterized membrane protein YdjX (TVP38/TMEM64 family)